MCVREREKEARWHWHQGTGPTNQQIGCWLLSEVRSQKTTTRFFAFLFVRALNIGFARLPCFSFRFQKVLCVSYFFLDSVHLPLELLLQILRFESVPISKDFTHSLQQLIARRAIFRA